MGYLAPVFARCPRCGVCTELGSETNRGGHVFCSNCGRETPMTEWGACTSREFQDASVSGKPIFASVRPLRRRPPSPAPRPLGHVRMPTAVAIGAALGLAGLALGAIFSRRHATATTALPPVTAATSPAFAPPSSRPAFEIERGQAAQNPSRRR